MERWGVAVNGYFGSASVIREKGPWWNFLIEWLMWRTSHALHFLIGWLPLPKWLTRRKVVAEGEEYSWGDWHGTKVEQLFWHVEQPIFDWCHERRKTVMIHMSFAKVREAFGEEAPASWQKDWDEGTEMWRKNGPPNESRSEVFRTASS